MWACLCFSLPAFSVCFSTKHSLSTFCLLTVYQFWKSSQQLCLWITAFLPLYPFILQRYWSLLVCFPSLDLSFIFLTIWSVSATFLINSSLSSSTSLMLFSSVSASSLLCQLSFHLVTIFSLPGFLICLLFVFICSCFILACFNFPIPCVLWQVEPFRGPNSLPALKQMPPLLPAVFLSEEAEYVSSFLNLAHSVTYRGPERAEKVVVSPWSMEAFLFAPTSLLPETVSRPACWSMRDTRSKAESLVTSAEDTPRHVSDQLSSTEHTAHSDTWANAGLFFVLPRFCMFLLQTTYLARTKHLERFLKTLKIQS